MADNVVQESRFGAINEGQLRQSRVSRVKRPGALYKLAQPGPRSPWVRLQAGSALPLRQPALHFGGERGDYPDSCACERSCPAARMLTAWVPWLGASGHRDLPFLLGPGGALQGRRSGVGCECLYYF